MLLQVLSLTPQQINALPPNERNTILQLVSHVSSTLAPTILILTIRMACREHSWDTWLRSENVYTEVKTAQTSLMSIITFSLVHLYGDAMYRILVILNYSLLANNCPGRNGVQFHMRSAKLGVPTA